MTTWPRGRNVFAHHTFLLGFAARLGACSISLRFRSTSPAAWAWFIGAFPIGSKIVLVAMQYLITRGTVRRRIRVSRLALAAG